MFEFEHLFSNEQEDLQNLFPCYIDYGQYESMIFDIPVLSEFQKIHQSSLENELIRHSEI